MKTILLWVLIFVFGFIMWAGAGFKILQGISTDLVVEATKNTSAQFQQAYSGSEAQKRIQDLVDQQKGVISAQISAGLQTYISGLFGKK